MIIFDDNSKFYKKPFEAIKNNNFISFNNGFIFDIDKNSDSEDFPAGCLFKTPYNIEDSFFISAGDLFYLRIDLQKLDFSAILQNPEEIKGSSRYKYIKICEINPDLSVNQILTQNVFLTELKQEKAFEIVKTGEIVGNKSQYRVNGGWVICVESGVIKFVDDYYFFYDDSSSEFINGDEKYIYFELGYKASTSKETGEDTDEGIGSVGEYTVVSGATLKSVKIKESGKPLENSPASTSNLNGTYYLLIKSGLVYVGASESNSGTTLWGLGDVDFPPNYPGEWNPIGRSRTGAAGGWYGWVLGGGIPEERAVELWEKVIEENYDGPIIFNIIPYQEDWLSQLVINYA